MQCAHCKTELAPGEGQWTNSHSLCSACYQAPRHRYFYILRPPNIGCQPDGRINAETWRPTRRTGLAEWYAHGWVEYIDPLEPEQQWHYDLMAADPAELEAYRTWREENHR